MGDVSEAHAGQVMSATTTYNQIANENLKNLGLETCAAGEDLLQDANEDVAEGGADEHSVQRHLGRSMKPAVPADRRAHRR